MLQTIDPPGAGDGATGARPFTTAEHLNAAFRDLDAIGRLRLLRREIGGRLVFTTSFGLEDQALTHLVAGSGVCIEIVTLDTGRLFPETHGVWAATEQRYGRRVCGFSPEAAAVEALLEDQGIDGFYHSKEARHDCCNVRKLAPLARALTGAATWITGLRADQSAVRQDMSFVAYDSERRLLKANPLLDWSREQVADFVAANDIPSNSLHARGFLSIGCAPCTRAVRPGEAERSGRWWWESDGTAECGLHLTKDGRLVRGKAA